MDHADIKLRMTPPVYCSLPQFEVILVSIFGEVQVKLLIMR